MRSHRQMLPAYIFCALVLGADLLVYQFDPHRSRQAVIIHLIVAIGMCVLMARQLKKFKDGKK